MSNCESISLKVTYYLEIGLTARLFSIYIRIPSYLIPSNRAYRLLIVSTLSDRLVLLLSSFNSSKA
jgi:hypothetical protein